MSARVYQPDHTAHIRRRLHQMTTQGSAGLILACGAAGIAAVLANRADDADAWIFRIAWYAVAAVASLSLLTILATRVGWMLYRRQRADLDAAGAEAVGELNARRANARRDDGQT
jgi:hypothetical protein